MHVNRKQRGFTLLELMIVVVVIAILAAVAYPSYLAYVQRGRIAEATSTLADMRVRLEQFFQDNRTYVGAPVCAAPPPVQAFQYDCPTLTATAFTARAQGVTTQGMTGFTFTIDQSNAQQTTAFPGASGFPKNCWMQKKGDGC